MDPKLSTFRSIQGIEIRLFLFRFRNNQLNNYIISLKIDFFQSIFGQKMALNNQNNFLIWIKYRHTFGVFRSMACNYCQAQPKAQLSWAEWLYFQLIQPTPTPHPRKVYFAASIYPSILSAQAPAKLG